MIGFLNGPVIDRVDTRLTILVAGIGYEVSCTLNALALASGLNLDSNAETVELWTHLVVREDVQQLYGFADRTERSLFRELIRISGIGPKVALAILSGMDSSGLVHAIQSEDYATLSKIPGIGKKTAERLVVEMKDRLADWEVGAAIIAGSSDQALKAKPDMASEAEAALIALGYKPAESSRMIASLDKIEGETLEGLIRRVLRDKLS